MIYTPVANCLSSPKSHSQHWVTGLQKITFGFPNLSNAHNFREPKSSVFSKVTPHTHTCKTHLCSISLAAMPRRREEKRGVSCWHGSFGTKHKKHWNTRLPSFKGRHGGERGHFLRWMHFCKFSGMWYLSCNSSLQTPVAASGPVCECPRLP